MIKPYEVEIPPAGWISCQVEEPDETTLKSTAGCRYDEQSSRSTLIYLFIFVTMVTLPHIFYKISYVPGHSSVPGN